MAGPRARTPIVGGNWKMNTDLASGVELAGDVAAGCADCLEHTDVVLYPPFPYLHAVGQAIWEALGQANGLTNSRTNGKLGLTLGAQDVYPLPNGAFTGEVSTDMLLDLNATMVLAGHSERRHVIGEGDDLVNAKLRAALAAGLHVTLCIGETREQREADETEQVNVDQLTRGLDGVETGRDTGQMSRVVIAYEPVWAIGTGLASTADDAQVVHALIRRQLERLFDADVAAATRIQYGGSVKPNNAAELIARPDIDGFLVGGASLKADDFLAIVRAVAEATRNADSSATSSSGPGPINRLHHEARNA